MISCKSLVTLRTLGGQGGVRKRVCDRVVKGNNTLVCEVEASYQYRNK